MAKLDLHPLLRGLRGSLGGLVFRQRYGKPYVSRRPGPSTRPPSLAQQTQRERMREATAFAHEALLDPAVAAHYSALGAARERPLPAFTALVADRMTRPEIRSVHAVADAAVGCVIRIEAHDPYGVASVEVALARQSGPPFETGLATREGAAWIYRTRVSAPRSGALLVRVCARDHADNVTDWEGSVALED